MLHGISPPWWNSLESVQKVHGRLELLAIFLFGVLVLLDILEHGAKEPRATFLKKCALKVFALAVLTELVAYPYSQRSDKLSNNQIRNDEQTISKLSDDVRVASQHANEAAGAAAKAKDSAKQANDLARAARQEADSFEKDIKSAKEQAAAAESHLAEALNRVAQATAELNRLKTLRSLGNPSAVTAWLEQFKGTEYTFSGVGADEDSVHLLVTIDKVLQDAGWKRVKPSATIVVPLNLPGEKDFGVPLSLDSGVRVLAESSEEISVLKKMPSADLPRPLNAAVALNLALFANIFPPEPNLRDVNVTKGTSKTVSIVIGKKI